MTVETAASATGRPERADWHEVDTTEATAPAADGPANVAGAAEVAQVAEPTEPDDDYRAFTPRPRLMSPLTWVLLFALTASAGFLLGARLQHRSTSGSASSTASAAAAFAAAAARGGATFGGGGGFGQGGAATVASSTAGTRAATPSATGTVKLVDGSNLYVADAQGNIVKVAVGAGARVVVTQPATLSALAVGQTVTVEGTTGADGTLQATLVTGVAAPGPATPAPSAATPAP